MIRLKLIASVLFIICQISISVAQEWKLDLDEAKLEAQDSSKTIILVFSGSDWCAPCIKLEKEIWESEEFKTYATGHYVMVRADFPKKSANKLPKEQDAKNGALAEKYNPNGYFPLVVVMDKNAKVIGNTGYKSMTPAAYIEHLNSFIK
jgi:thioredoxin-related protein